jgi:PAS domain S-box-containing protein
MLEQRPPVHVLRNVAIALLLALALEVVRQIAVDGFSAWSSDTVTSSLYVSLFFLLTFASLWNSRFQATSLIPAVAGIANAAAFVILAERRQKPETVGNVVSSRQLTLSEERLRESEDKYRLLVATIPEVVWKTDARGNVIFVSPQVEALLGYSAEEFCQHGDSLWFNSVHPDDKERVGKAFESLLKSGESYDIECRAQKKNGEWFWAHDRAVVTSDSNGFRVATGIISDISVRKASEESENRYRSLFENMLEGFAHCEMLFDEGGCPIDFLYLDVNRAFGKLTGLANVVGKKFSEIVPGGKDSQPELFERYCRVALTSQPERFETEIKALGMWFSISAYGAGNRCFVATFDNITERKAD